MVLKPRWVHPLNFREEDKETLDAALQIAKSDGSSLTDVIRIALKEYAGSRLRGNQDTIKMDDFLRSTVNPQYLEILTPTVLKEWTDNEVLTFAKLVRARRQEIEHELRKRGYFFEWVKTEDTN
jgi:hypothetical protein